MGLSVYYFKCNSYTIINANNAINGVMGRIGMVVVGCALYRLASLLDRAPHASTARIQNGGGGGGGS